MNEFSPVDQSAGEPLYLGVRRRLVADIANGTFATGSSLPSEVELARRLGVHQGTVRKAIDGLVADRVLVRRQGSGTYVATPDDEAILFRFYRLKPDAGPVRFPRSRILSRETAAASAAEVAALSLNAGAVVHRFVRVRLVDETPLLVETITLPLALFPGIEAMTELPNNVYRLYSDMFAVTVARADEQVKATAATPQDEAALGLKAGTPLLEITRIAHDLADRALELRVSRSRSDIVHYANTLR